MDPPRDSHSSAAAPPGSSRDLGCAMPLGPDDVRLRDRIAIVTGAAQGIGAAIAETFARFGADLALCDRNGDALAATAERARSAGGRVRTAVLDVRDGDAVNHFV